MDYEAMWNELLLALTADDGLSNLKTLNLMDKINTQYTTKFIKAIQSTRP